MQIINYKLKLSDRNLGIGMCQMSKTLPKHEAGMIFTENTNTMIFATNIIFA